MMSRRGGRGEDGGRESKRGRPVGHGDWGGQPFALNFYLRVHDGRVPHNGAAGGRTGGFGASGGWRGSRYGLLAALVVEGGLRVAPPEDDHRHAVDARRVGVGVQATLTVDGVHVLKVARLGRLEVAASSGTEVPRRWACGKTVCGKGCDDGAVAGRLDVTAGCTGRRPTCGSYVYPKVDPLAIA